MNRRVLFLALGGPEVASSRTRVFQYLPYLPGYGVSATVVVRNPYMLKESRNRAQRLLRSAFIRARMAGFLALSMGFRVIVIQKALLPAAFYGFLRFLGKRIAFDFDDAIYSTFDGKGQTDRNLRRLADTRRCAHLVFVENDVNRAYARRYCPDVRIITGPIECRRYRPRPRADSGPTTIGWIGSSRSSIYLSLLDAPLRALARRFPGAVRVLLVGVTTAPFTGVPVECHPWELDTEVQLLGRFDIGVMPLFDDEFAQGKGGYKILQYMAMGIPVVASPVGINSELVREGQEGFLAEDGVAWEERLGRLVSDPALRARLGANGRRRATLEYSFERYAGVLARALQEAGER